MRVKYSPQRNDKKILYQFANNTIIATIDSVTDTFDFTNNPDGEIYVPGLTTILPINPIVSAKKENGILSVELLYFHGVNATYDELFPDWVEA